MLSFVIQLTCGMDRALLIKCYEITISLASEAEIFKSLNFAQFIHIIG